MSRSLAARLGARVAAGAVALVTMSGLLAVPAAAQASEKPYFEGKKLAWTYVSLTQPKQSFWNSAGDAPVGLGTRPTGLFRSFFRMDISKVSRTHILDATFATFQNSGECKPGVELWITDGISQKTTWRNQPQWVKKLGATSDTDCSGPNRVNWAMTEAVTEAAARGDQSITFGLRSANEADIRGRHVFETEYYLSDHLPIIVPMLRIHYNTTPGVPADPFIPPCQGYEFPPPTPMPYLPTGYACTTTPDLFARVTDPDTLYNTTTPQEVWARFEWRTAGGAQLGDMIGTLGYAGGWYKGTIPEGQLVDGGAYEWRVRAEDGIDVSEWTSWYGFTVDATPPDREPLVTSTDYPEEEFNGGVGVPGTFTFTPNGVTDIAGYRYGFQGGIGSDLVPANGDGSLTITFTPDRTGPFFLRVVSVDRAGNRSPQRDYMFFVN